MKNKVTQRVNSNSKKSILNAAEVILNGGIIVYPTDTLYGFGVDANNISAINKLNKLKGREGPISVIMQDIDTIISCAKIDDVEAEIIRKNLIGYTTIILPVKSGTVYKSIMGEGETLGIRLPDHSFATNLCKLINGPITTTSVNRSGEIPLNDPNEIFKVFNGEFDLLIDDGCSIYGLCFTLGTNEFLGSYSYY